MSYQVLARKWRPAKFEEMVGQSHVLLALTNALTQQRLHHAYLFTGTRGVGKTSLARLFAKGLNCEQGVTATPCGVCSSCVEIAQGRFVDLIEVDAASRTKVDDTRELLDNVQYKPSRGRYKVYLIDEVHMLSRSSFNALLKTLEEPPEHVKFLLATTDPQKLPVTVLSRCLQFNLKSLSQDEITKQLDFVLTQEQLNFEPQALSLLAKAANGSMRDALSLTDQAIAFGSGQVMHQQVQSMLGSIDAQQVLALLKSLCDADIAILMQTIQQVLSFGADADEVLRSLLELLHQITLSQFAPAAAQQSLYSEQILAFAQQLTPEQVQLYYQLLLTGRKELSFAPDPKSGLEMALLRAVAFVPEKLVKRWHTDEPVSISLTPTKAATASHTVVESELKSLDRQSEEKAESTVVVSHDSDNVIKADAAIAAEQAIIMSQADSLGFKRQPIASDPKGSQVSNSTAESTQVAESKLVMASQQNKLPQIDVAKTGFNSELAPKPATDLVAETVSESLPEMVSVPEQEKETSAQKGTSVIKPQANADDSEVVSNSNDMPIDAYEQFSQASDESYVDYENDDHSQYQQADTAVSASSEGLNTVSPTSMAESTPVQQAQDSASSSEDLDALLDAVLATNDSLKAELTSLAEEGEQAKKQQAVSNPSSRIPAPKPKAQPIESTASDVVSTNASESHDKAINNIDDTDRPPWEKPLGLPAQVANNETEVSNAVTHQEPMANHVVKKETLTPASNTENTGVNNTTDRRQLESQPEVINTSMTMTTGSHEVLGDSLDLHWYKIMSELTIGGRVRQLAVNSVCQRLGNPIPLLLKPDQKHLSADVAIEQLQIALTEHLGEDTKVEINVGLDPQHETPLELRKRFHRELLANANYALINDDKVQWMFTRLAAELNTDTLVYPVEKLQAIGKQIPALTVQ